MSYITAENTKVAEELEILRSQDRRLKETIFKMETALDKVILGEASGCFALQLLGRRKRLTFYLGCI